MNISIPAIPVEIKTPCKAVYNAAKDTLNEVGAQLNEVGATLTSETFKEYRIAFVEGFVNLTVLEVLLTFCIASILAGELLTAGVFLILLAMWVEKLAETGF